MTTINKDATYTNTVFISRRVLDSAEVAEPVAAVAIVPTVLDEVVRRRDALFFRRVTVGTDVRLDVSVDMLWASPSSSSVYVPYNEQVKLRTTFARTSVIRDGRCATSTFTHVKIPKTATIASLTPQPVMVPFTTTVTSVSLRKLEAKRVAVTAVRVRCSEERVLTSPDVEAPTVARRIVG